MQTIFFIIGLIGIVMFIFGMKTLVKTYKNKTVGKLSLTESENEINFEKTGLYAICVIGGGYVNNLGNFEVKIFNDRNELDTVEKHLKFKFHHNGKLATEFYQFEIENPGIHKFIFKGSSDLEVKESLLSSKRMFQSKLNIENIGIIVKETSSGVKYIFSLVMSILGFNIAGVGILLALNPHVYG